MTAGQDRTRMLSEGQHHVRRHPAGSVLDTRNL
jgi:hypothetical protein